MNSLKKKMRPIITLRKRPYRSSILVVFFVCISFSFSNTAQQKESPPQKKKEKITINSEEWKMVPKSNQAVYKNNVLLEHPDFTMKSNQFTVYLKEESQQEEGGELDFEKSVEKATALGYVVLKDKESEKVAMAKKATYFPDRGLIKLEGWPVIQKGKGEDPMYVMATDKKTYVLYYTRESKGGESIAFQGPSKTSGDLKTHLKRHDKDYQEE